MCDENPLFDFDTQDHVKRRELANSLTGAGIFFTLLTAVDLKVLNRMKSARTMSIMKKLVLLNIMNTPFYVYFYHDISRRYMELKKHLVTKYLIIGDELMFKKKI